MCYVLVSLDTLKAGYGWSDEELYDHFLYDLQVRYAVGYESLAEGDFELRTLYNFRRRLSQYNLEHSVTLIQTAIKGRKPDSAKLHLADFAIT